MSKKTNINFGEDNLLVQKTFKGSKCGATTEKAAY